jgi:type VI secretion system secreted protein VgrG
MSNFATEESMSKFAPALSNLMDARQNNRMLRMSFPNDDGPHAILLPHKLHADEALSIDFQFNVELLAEDACIPLKEMLGKMVTISLVRGDGTLRHFNGYVFEFRLVKTDGAFAYYGMLLQPWLAYLKQRKNNFLFHGQNLREQTDCIFKQYGTHAAWDYRLADEDPQMTMACQFDESDHNYLHRRWEALGWHYWYEHDERGHTLILSDNSTCAVPVDGEFAIEYQRHAGAVEEEGIGDWSPVGQFAPNSVALSRFDFKSPRPQHVSVDSINEQGAVPQVEAYEYAGAHGFADQADGVRQATLRMEAIEAGSQRVDAGGNCRRVQPGRSFRLGGHFELNDDASHSEFLVLSVRHEASNNYLQNADEPAHYENLFSCIRKKIKWRPGRGYQSIDTRIFGIQTATVVGPTGENLHVDIYGRVRVQFHWDRIGQDNENSSAWVRVASGWAGAQMGFLAIPRIGQSVLVQWLDGNCDRPVITGSVANRDNMPPWALPGELSLTGMRSRELVPGGGNSAGGRSGHLIFDDSHGKIQTQLKSDHLHSQLSLGHITRIDDNSGRQDGRGEGFELRSDGVGVLRAGGGMLVTSEGRADGAGHLTDMGETVQRLSQARATHEDLAGLAQLHKAQNKNADQSDVAGVLKQQNDAIKGAAGSFPELVEAHVVIASPSGIETTTAGSTHIASGEHLAVSTGGHVSVAAGRSLYASVAQKFSLFVHQLGMKLIAASGKVQIQAQTDDLELLAQKVLDIISTTGWINLTAKEGIRLNGGGSELVINADGITGMTGGAHHIHAADHQTMGPQVVPAEFPGAKVCSSRTAGAAQNGNATVPVA